MGTRTPIRFGAILEALASEKLKNYKRFLNETTSQSLLFGYRCRFAGNYYGFILVQAARNAGRVTAEIAISRAEEYPYYRFSDQPRVGITGFRERVYVITRKEDLAQSYRGAEQLLGLMMDLLRESEVALARVSEEVTQEIVEGYKTWQPLYREWLQAEKGAREGETRYPGLEGEVVAREVLQDILVRGTFDRFLGPLKFRYRNPDFYNCHLFLLAKALEFLEPPPVSGVSQPQEEEDDFDPHSGPLPDPIASLTGRQSQPECLELARSTALRTTQWAFLKSFAAAEAFFLDNDAAEARFLDEASPEPESGAPLDQLYEGIMEEPAYATAAPPAEPPVATTRSASPKKRGRPDPFEKFADYVNVDPFDVLGSQF